MSRNAHLRESTSPLEICAGKFDGCVANIDTQCSTAGRHQGSGEASEQTTTAANIQERKSRLEIKELERMSIYFRR